MDTYTETKQTNGKDWKSIIKNKYTVGLFLVVLIKSVFVSRIGFNLIDEGEYLHNALRILNGDVPYKDFFSYQPPLYNYWNVIAFKIFGISAFSARLFNSIVFSIAMTVMFLIMRRFSSQRIAITMAMAFSFMEVSMERLYYHIFTFSGLMIFFISRSENNKFKLFVSGILFGITTLFRIDVGFLVFSGICTGIVLDKFDFRKVVLREKLIQLLTILFGYLLIISMFVVWLYLTNSYFQFYRSILGTPLQISSSYSLPFPKPWDTIPTNLNPKSLFHSYETYVLYSLLLTSFIYTIMLYRTVKKIWNLAPETIYLFIISILMAPYMFGRTDLGHIVKAFVPAYFLSAYVYDHLDRFKKIYILIPISFIVVGAAQIVWTNNFFSTVISTKSGDIRLNSTWPDGTLHTTSNTVKESIQFIEENTDQNDQIFVAPYMPGLYFLTNRPSKTYVGNVLITYIPDEEKFVQKLSEMNVKVIIYDPVNGPENENGLKQMKSYYPLLDNYIMSNYEIIDQSEEGWLYMLKKS